MKALVIGTDITMFNKGSASRARLEEYAGLFSEYHMVVYTPPGFRDIALPNNLFIYPTNSLFFFMRPFDATRIAAKVIRERGIDTVSVQDPAETGFAGWLLKKRYGVRLHIQIHADFLSPFFRKNSWKELVRYWLARFIIPRGDKFRVVSRRIANSLHSAFGIPRSALSVLPIFVDRERIANAKPMFDLRKKYPEFDFIILMVSRLVREKNIGLALESFRELLKEFPQSGLVIVGDGPEYKSLEFRVKSLKLTDNVRMEGWQDDLISYYKGADVYLLTSNFEGYGRTVVEAAAAGCPVVMTDVGVAGEIIEDGKSGRVVRVGSVSELLAALLWVRQNISAAHQMAKTAEYIVLKLPPAEWPEYLRMYAQSFIVCPPEYRAAGRRG